MKIFNGTQHQINLYSINDCYEVQGGRKLVVQQDAKPVLVIESGSNLNAVKGNAPLPDIFSTSELPLVGTVVFTGYDALPEGFDLYIVSNLYRSAVKELGGSTEKLATVNGVVYDDKDAVKPCGCTSLAVG